MRRVVPKPLAHVDTAMRKVAIESLHLPAPGLGRLTVEVLLQLLRKLVRLLVLYLLLLLLHQ